MDHDIWSGVVDLECTTETITSEKPEGREDLLEGREDLLEGSPKLKNPDISKKLQEKKFSHLTALEQDEMMQLIFEFVKLFPDTPTQTSYIFHDVDVEDTAPNKQHPYCLNPVKLEIM